MEYQLLELEFLICNNNLPSFEQPRVLVLSMLVTPRIAVVPTYTTY